jgi:IS5 family transposase
MERDMFRSDLSAIIDMGHKLARLSNVIEWKELDEEFGKTYCCDKGRSGVSTRLMVSLHYFKYTYNLSDVEVLNGWIENPYWQYFSGMRRFQHTIPIDSSSMTRWRKRIGEVGAERLLQETIKAGLKLKAVKKSELKRLNVDTTVQEKSIRFPTDAGLYNRCREKLVEFAKERGIKLRQSYKRVSKHLCYKYNKYSHARQMKRAGKCIKKLNTILGRVKRDVERKALTIDDELKELLEVSERIYTMKRKDKNKIYSIHEPYVECIKPIKNMNSVAK